MPTAGVVLLILFAVAVGFYLLVGMLYKRVVQGAKGFEQIPNIDFWLDVIEHIGVSLGGKAAFTFLSHLLLARTPHSRHAFPPLILCRRHLLFLVVMLICLWVSFSPALNHAHYLCCSLDSSTFSAAAARQTTASTPSLLCTTT